jgi:glycerophosphoryl diester phosphodiesterase
MAAQPESTGDSTSALGNGKLVRYTAAQFLALNKGPIVIGHEGDGENFPNAQNQPTDPTRPINDTVASVLDGYLNGASIVEVDAQITKDGVAVAYHDFDFLPDNTCINSYNLRDLQKKEPYINRLDEILGAAQLINLVSPHISGILIVELKTPSPLCDPNDTAQVPYVQNIVNTVNRSGMQEAVIFDGFSPVMLQLAQQQAPNIPRELDFDLLQLLTPAEVTGATGLPVTIITPTLNLGLEWADIGEVYRLPGYSSPTQFLEIAGEIGASVIGTQLDFVQEAEATQPGSTAEFVGGAHEFGFKAWADPAADATGFSYFTQFGFDGAYCDNIKSCLTDQEKL